MGEFKEFGFELRADLRPDLVGVELDAFEDRLIDVVEARKLGFGGGAGRDDKLALDELVLEVGDGPALEHLLDDVANRLVLEDPAILAAAEEPEPGNEGHLVERHVEIAAGIGGMR